LLDDAQAQLDAVQALTLLVLFGADRAHMFVRFFLPSSS